jgi:hypothetical protein
MRTHHIPAELVKLALLATRANDHVRWAAMADGVWSTRSCTWRKSAFDTLHRQPALLTPMQRGRLHHAIQRQRDVQGLASIRATFGTGLRALLAEPPHILRTEVRQ